MDLFSNLYGFIFTLLGIVGGLIFEVTYHLVLKKPWSAMRLVFVPLAAGLIALVVEKIVEIDSRTERLTELANSFVFMQADDKIRDFAPNSTMRCLLTDEMTNIKERLVLMSHGEMRLRREEVIPKWELLIKHANSEILATNVVTYNDWKEFSPSQGDAVNRDAVKRHVKVRRIFIYDAKDSAYTAGLLTLAKRHDSMGVEVKIIDNQWVLSSSFLSDYYRNLGTLDIVIYDDECVLLTTVDREYKIIWGEIVTNPPRLQRAKEFYEKLWEDSKTISQFSQKK